MFSAGRIGKLCPVPLRFSLYRSFLVWSSGGFFVDPRNQNAQELYPEVVKDLKKSQIRHVYKGALSPSKGFLFPQTINSLESAILTYKPLDHHRSHTTSSALITSP